MRTYRTTSGVEITDFGAGKELRKHCNIEAEFLNNIKHGYWVVTNFNKISQESLYKNGDIVNLSRTRKDLTFYFQ